MLKTIILIGVGSFFGGIFRFAMSQFVQAKFLSTFPFGTIGVNLLGCFLIGTVIGLSEKGSINQEWRLFLATGILGGFTTFSAFSAETIAMLRDGQLVPAVAYILSSVALGLVATFAGISLSKLI